ncbi:MAG: MerR family transcriptional regulator [Lachnospiraceae bacterium]|nr:MerR family transcriptional regulator [Lachnospiraceae bacterium]
MKTFSIGEVSKIMNLSIPTLRYYDKEGLLDTVERTEGGIRIFHQEDLDHLRMLECLKSTGMPLKDIRTFFEWCKQGDSTVERRYQMFLDRKAEVERQMESLKKTMATIEYKCQWYKEALEAQTQEKTSKVS